MKTIRSLTTLTGITLVLLAMSATGAKAQGLLTTRFEGTFHLPFEAQWGKMALPAGDYTLRYDTRDAAHGIVVVRGAAKGSPYGMVLAGPAGETSGAKNAIVCIREGDALIVRALEMPAIGESVRFTLPRGAKLMAHKGSHKGYGQLAEAPMLIQRIPITLNAK